MAMALRTPASASAFASASCAPNLCRAPATRLRIPSGQTFVSRVHFGRRSSAAEPQRNAHSSSKRIAARAEVQYFNAEEAKKAVEEDGYTVVDVRDQSQYDRAHVKGSVHIPLFVENTDMDPVTMIKRQAHNNFTGMLYGLPFTKMNEQFVSTVEQKFTKDSKVLLVCQEGLRSGTALEQLEELGYQNVALLTAGLQKVPPGTFPSEGARELNQAGKAGFVAIQQQFSFVLGAIIFLAYLYLEFFPEQSSQVLKGFVGR